VPQRVSECRLCGSSTFATVSEQDGVDEYLELIGISSNEVTRRWLKCKNCGLVIHDPQLTAADTRILYERFRDTSFREETPDQYFDRIMGLPAEQSENHEKCVWFKSFIPTSDGPSNILDIGCGGGVLLAMFRQQFGTNWSTYGVEPTPSFAELADRRLGGTVLNSNYTSGLFQGVKFQLITCSQVLEHVDDPLNFLSQIGTDLAENGHLYLETPDIRDFETLPTDHDRFQMQHFWYFSEETIRAFARLAGLRVVTSDIVSTVRKRNNIAILLCKNS